MKTEVLRAAHPVALPHAADVLRNGGLVAFPTDTVYGLAAMAFEADFIDRLYVVKGRDTARAIAVLISEQDELKKVSQTSNDVVLRLTRKFWPGPLTLIVPRHPSLPDILSRDQTIGVRIPNHPIALSLLRLTGPLAVTSANLSGQKNACTAKDVLAQLKGRIHLIIDGGTSPGGIPSTVVDCMTTEPVVLREGPISFDNLKEALQEET